ncbi:hypothetical protein [Roseimaritima ulvae]|uniref:Tetratricopeptide repeat protein n=1 Tax=Roseimaritima ulvae TaxID=980254 RepID=A0A5B9QNZ4_9BACT|nr:hypothetical protein [Roseimaritima ulvae]QEG39669.1 hypothetical protein UC8_16650 [Roseimaritima ulvae]
MQSLDFKFRFLDEAGTPQGFLAKKGSLSDETLTLDGQQIPAIAIENVALRQDRMVLVIRSGEEPEAYSSIMLVVYSVAAQLKGMLDAARSQYVAEARRRQLQAEGREYEFRAVPCPACGATLDVTDFEPTPQVYCDFCEVISTVGTDTPVKNEGEYKLCDTCGMYSSPRRFTSFYFYFLLVIYGWHSRTSYRCPACMRGEAWKMLAGNMLFVLGVPAAIYQLVRAYGSDRVAGAMAGLHAANLAAKNGNVSNAVAGYTKILDRIPVAAGLHYNLALSLANSNQLEQAAAAAELSLGDCSNYRPSAGLLLALYEQMGQDEQVAALKKQWGVEDPEPQAADQQTTDDQAADHLLEHADDLPQ